MFFVVSIMIDCEYNFYKFEQMFIKNAVVTASKMIIG